MEEEGLHRDESLLWRSMQIYLARGDLTSALDIVDQFQEVEQDKHRFSTALKQVQSKATSQKRQDIIAVVSPDKSKVICRV